MTEMEYYEDISTILPEIVYHINGKESDSASPSDTWFLKLSNSYYNGIRIEKAFIKIFMNYEDILKISKKELKITNSQKKAVGGLNYEILIYKYIIQNLVNRKICPNFVNYLGSSSTCSYKNLLSILENAMTEIGLDNNEKKYSFDSIIYKCLLQRCETRNKIDRRLIAFPTTKFATHDFYEYRFGMILTETIKSSTITFHKYLENYNVSNKSNDYSELYSILFQIAATCYALSLSKTNHNDLHSGNIFIELSEIPQIYIYVINSNRYEIETKYKVLVYDFDRGYNENFGDNPLLEGYHCEKAYQCNSFVENQDIIKSLCSVIRNICSSKRRDLRTELLKFISSDTEIQKTILNSFENSGCNFNDISNKYIREEFFSKCNNLQTIIKNFYSQTHNFKICKISEKNIFVCDTRFFEKNGNINEDSRKLIYQKEVNAILYPEESKEESKSIEEFIDRKKYLKSLDKIHKSEISDLDTRISKNSLDFLLDKSHVIASKPVEDMSLSENSHVIHKTHLYEDMSLFDSGENEPRDIELYNKVKKEGMKKFKKWPSAYGSAWLVKEYKKRGGTYSGKKSRKSGISRWMDEKWIDVCKLPKKVPCGRPKISAGSWKKKYPYCRPSVKINSKTPVIASKLSKKQIIRKCSIKRKSPLKRMKSIRRKSTRRRSTSKSNRK